MNSSYVATVPAYPELPSLLSAAPAASAWESHLTQRVVPYLEQVWLRHYRMAQSVGEIVAVSQTQVAAQFTYLFDIGPDRLIAAWGISRGRFAGARDNSRIRSYPISTRPVYHAGHAISHRLGGGADINLVPQLGAVNTGPFQTLERQASQTPGSLYFTYWMYNQQGNKAWIPFRTQQGLLIRNTQPDIRVFKN
jgi:hypothetical protein